MANQALYRKWRSQSFDDVIGQQHVIQTLQNALRSDRVAHAYLFTGPRGTGKTSTARILAKAINCTGSGEKPCNACSTCRAITEGRLMDLIEIDAASNTSVDDIRDLRDKVGFRPGEAKIKFYIIDEVHMLSRSAFNALLKTLEEPPAHVIFVLATTEPEKIPATIMSRCQRFDFRRIKLEDIVGRLRFILQNEQIQAEDDALTFIARQAGGAMRDAISLLDQLTAYGHEVITLELVQSVLGTASSGATKDLIDCWLAEDATAGLALINQVVNNGVDPKQFTLEVVEYLRGLLLIKYGDAEQFLNLPAETLQTMHAQAQKLAPAKLLSGTQRFNQAIKEFKSSAGDSMIPQLPLELAFLEALAAPTIATPTPIKAESVPAPAIATFAPPPAPKPAPVAPAVAAPPAVKTESPAPAATSAPATPVSALTKDELRRRWPAILDEVKIHSPNSLNYLKKPMMQGLDIQGDTINLQFGASYRDALKRVDKNKSAIIDAFRHVLGQQWNVEFILLSDNAPVQAGGPIPVPETPPPAEPPEDELVKFALNSGGQISPLSK